MTIYPNDPDAVQQRIITNELKWRRDEYPKSDFEFLKPAAVSHAAEAMARDGVSIEGLPSALAKYRKAHPDAFMSKSELAAWRKENPRGKARPEYWTKMTAEERLAWANGSGVPPRLTKKPYPPGYKNLTAEQMLAKINAETATKREKGRFKPS